MFLDPSSVNIFVRPGYTDMRKAINGLAVMVKDYMNEEPLSGGLYLFCNRQRRILKALYWDRNGFCLWLVGAKPLLAHASWGKRSWKSTSSPGR